MALLIQQNVDGVVAGGLVTKQEIKLSEDVVVTSVKLRFRTLYSGVTSGFSTLQVTLDGEVKELTGNGLVGNYPSYTTVEFTFDTPVPLNGSQTYVISIFMHDTGLEPTGYVACSASDQNPYALGRAFRNGGWWTEGDLWFEVYGALASNLPSKPINPSPANGAIDQRLNTVDLSWDDGGGADTYDVYAEGWDGSLELMGSDIPQTSFTIPWLFRPGYSTNYSWRIDAINANGTTTGDTWSWTTMAFSPPNPNPAGGNDPIGDGGGGASGYMPGGAVTSPKMRLVIAADNKIFYEDV